MGIKTLIVILASLGFTTSALADDHEGGEKKPFSIYGDFAGSMSFYDSENTAVGFQNPNNNHDDFNVDLVELNLEKNWSKSKLLLSVGWGNTIVGAGGINPAYGLSGTNVNVLNAYYHMMSDYGLGFTFGSFESPVGHETYNQMDNSQYSRSYGYLLAPFFSTGLDVHYKQDMWSAGLIFSNGSGLAGDGRDNNKTMALVVDVDPMDNLHIDLNYVTGTEGQAGSTPTASAGLTHQINILDISAAYMVNEMFDVALNYIDHGQKLHATGATEKKANSIAAYANANFGMFGLGLRYEQLSYDNGFILYNGLATAIAAPAGTDNSISSITLAAKAEIDQNALVMLEYRMDSADDNGTFTEKDGATATDSFNTITLGLMYRF